MEENKLKALVVLLRASRSVEKVLKDEISSYGLNSTEFGVMEYLYHRGESPMNILCSKLLMANSSMTYVIDNLIKRGYVIKYIDDIDKRSNFVKLTSDGRNYIESIFPKHQKKIESIFSNLNNDETLTLTQLLKKVGLNAKKLNSNEGGK